MACSLREVVFVEFELFEHCVVGAGLQFVLGVADHSSQTAQYQKTVRAFAPICPPGERYAIALGVPLHSTDKLVSAHRLVSDINVRLSRITARRATAVAAVEIWGRNKISYAN